MAIRYIYYYGKSKYVVIGANNELIYKLLSMKTNKYISTLKLNKKDLYELKVFENSFDLKNLFKLNIYNFIAVILKEKSHYLKFPSIGKIFKDIIHKYYILLNKYGVKG